MKKIYYKGISQNYIEVLKELSEQYFIEEYNDQPIAEEVVSVILGEETEALIKLIQSISKEDKNLSIHVIPSNPNAITQLKASIQFAPFINKFVYVADSLRSEDIKNTILKNAELTYTRKIFKKTHTGLSEKVTEIITTDSNLRLKFLDKFLGQAPVGIILLDDKHKILDANQNALELIPGINSNFNNSIFKAFPGSLNNLKTFLKKDHPPEENIIIAIEEGQHKKYARLYTSKIASGDTEYIMLMLLDITYEVEMEIKNDVYLQNLERHNKELEQFAFIVTHDLKNPLSTIMLSCEMTEDASPEDTDRFVNIIKRSASNLLHMLEGLEEMIDVRKDNKERVSVVDFNEIYSDIYNEYQFQVQRHNITIENDFTKAPKINYIRSYLVSIIHNLINNAIKYRKADEPLHLKVETLKIDRFVVLRISDNGIGIDLKAHGEDLFRPFRRFTEQATGKGIGLSLVKSMIEKNNGKIEVESAPEKGTTFNCYLCPYT